MAATMFRGVRFLIRSPWTPRKFHFFPVPRVGDRPKYSEPESEDSLVDLVALMSASDHEERFFLLDTLFEVSTRHFVPARHLEQFTYVLGANGDPVRIMSMNVYPPESQEFVRICAGGTQLVVTSHHRVMVQRGARHTVAPAYSLRVGDDVICSHGTCKVIEVSFFTDVAAVVQMTFDRDDPVRAVGPFPGAILSRGHGGFRTRHKA